MIRSFGWAKSIIMRFSSAADFRGLGPVDRQNHGQLRAAAGSVCAKPLVVAAPRSGFSLLIAVINNLLSRTPGAAPSLSRQLVTQLVDLTSAYMTERYKQTFARFGVTDDLIFNGEFHLIVGGPKWLDKQHPERAAVRKYFGARGLGDFLLITDAGNAARNGEFKVAA